MDNVGRAIIYFSALIITLILFLLRNTPPFDGLTMWIGMVILLAVAIFFPYQTDD